MTRKYIALNVDDETQHALEAYTFWGGYDTSVGWGGKPIEKFHFHTTLIYSKNDCDTLVNGTYPIAHTDWKPATIVDFDIFTFRDMMIPVLLLDTDYDSLHMHMRRLYTYSGCYCSYTDFKPHVSLSYNFKDDISLDMLKKIKQNQFHHPSFKPKFKIAYSSITIEDIEE